VTKEERQAYQKELQRVAKQHCLPASGNVEETIVQHFVVKLARWITAHGQPQTLTELLDYVAASLGMSFEEIRSDADLEDFLKRFPPHREPVMARVEAEFDDNTEAVTIHRSRHEPWERPFLSVINCRGRHHSRRYFSKWHEAVHRLVEGEQLQFAFRHTPLKELRKGPEEVLVDRIAAALAFYPGMFEPVFFQEYRRAGRLSFSVMDGIRELIAPDASRQSTMLACIKSCPSPVWYICCGLGYKREEARVLRTLQEPLLPNQDSWPQPKLRVKEAAGSPAALDLGIRIHPNMRVPDSSAVAKAFLDIWGSTHTSIETLESWETSSGGPIGLGTVEVEAFRSDDLVLAIMHLIPDPASLRGGAPGVSQFHGPATRN